MTVYVLTDGDYSDYHIIGIFSSEEVGLRAQKEFGGSFEEYELDEIGKDNRLKYQVIFRTDNSTIVYPERGNDKTNEVRRFALFSSDQYNYSVYVMAEDREHAVKIAADLVAQYKALPIQKS